MKKLLALLFILPSSIWAAPTVSTVTGTIQNGQSVVISGTGYGTKSPAAPALWAPFTSSLTPSTGSWGTIENMAWDADEGYNGTGGAKGTAGSGIWTMYLQSTGYSAYNALSAKTYIYSKERLNFIVGVGTIANNINFKTKRFWPASGSVSNLYSSSSHGRIYVENIGTESGYFRNCNPNTTSWVTKEWLMTASSASGVKDGTVEERFNGVSKHNGTIISRSASAPNDWTKAVVVHGVSANKGSWSPPWDNANNLWVDAVYVDRTMQRVMIGDQSTFANCRKLGLVIPTAWSATSITGTLFVPLNDFPAGTTNYLYVFDTTNTPNTAGKAIVIGGSIVGDPAPTVTSINISTGAYNGGTTSTATGTGFLSGVTVLVGTVSATGVNRTNSTTLSFIIPANTPGTTGYDVTATNTDGQFGVLPATVSYTSPVTNQPPYSVSAGDDWEITLPASALLSGAADDDGLPIATLTYLWQQKTGPGTITFADATALQTSAVFSSSGTYTITITADDSELSTESSAVSIIVHPAVTSGGSPGGTAFGFKRPGQ